MEELGAVSDPLNYALGLMLGGGWILVFWGVRKLFRGEIATPLQIAEKDKELEYAHETIRELKYQNSLLGTEMGETLDAILTAIKKVAEERGESA